MNETENSTVFNSSHLSNRIEGLLFNLRSFSEDYINEYSKGKMDFDAFMSNAIKKARNSHEHYIDLCNKHRESIWVQSDFVFDCLDIAAMLYVIAKRLFESGDYKDAESTIIQANFYILLFQRLDYAIEQETIRKNGAIKGGVTRANRTIPIKKLVVELLQSKRPPNGWKSKAEAARSMIDEIEEINEVQNRALEPTRIFIQLSSWMGSKEESNKEIYDMFNKTQSDKCRRKQKLKNRNNW